MKKYLFIVILICVTIFSSELYAQETVILSPDNTEVHIYLPGTVTVSGPRSGIYLAGNSKDGEFDFRQTEDDPYTFYREINFTYSFAMPGTRSVGRGKVFNVTEKTARVRLTCIDGYGLAENPIIIDVKPRTFSRIIFHKYDEDVPAAVNKIKCELIKLF